VSLQNLSASLICGVPGLNTNVRVRDQVVHVQTEDLGTARATIITHVFSSAGQVMRVIRFDYKKHLEHPNLRSILPRALRLQHTAVVQDLRAQAGEEVTPAPEDATPPPSLIADARNLSSDDPAVGGDCLRQRVESGVWDRLLLLGPSEPEQCQTSRLSVVPSTDEDSPAEPDEASAAQAWNEVAADCVRDAGSGEEDSVALAAFKEGLLRLRSNDQEGAVALWAAALQRQPSNRHYRAGLLGLLLHLERNRAVATR